VDYSNKLTREGYDNIRKELEDIIKNRRPAVRSRIKEAIALGDLSENFDYHDAKREQGMIEGRIMELKAILGNATVIEACESNGCVDIGVKVVIKDCDDDCEEEYTIVGPPESNPSEGKISYESSVGEALMGHKVGDIVTVKTAGGEFKYEILSME
jgi:transcription elongation factor GreA